MKIIKLSGVALASIVVSQASAANLTLGAQTLVSENNQNFSLSVFPGTASYDDSWNGTATFVNTLGDGTVIDYNFFNSPNDGIASYADGGAGRIPLPTVNAANVNGAGENWSDVWTTTDPMGFTTANNFGDGPNTNTFARAAEIDGTIDISGLASGQIYIPHGTFINQWALTLTMTGPGQTPIVAVNDQTTNGIGRNFGWVTDFNFVTDGLYDTISYNYTNADRDGSRARFMGVILDGTPIPEPSRAILLGLGASLLFLRRRR